MRHAPCFTSAHCTHAEYSIAAPHSGPQGAPVAVAAARDRTRHCGGCEQNAPAAGRLRGFFAEGFIGDEVMKELLAMLRFLGAGETIPAVEGHCASSAIAVGTPGSV